ncbi:MAG: hypothetical protein AAF433_02730 [Bacteroidota bacterium]
MTTQQITLKYVLTVAAIVVATWLVHEFAHWLMSEALGYDAIMSFNKVWSVSGQSPTTTHALLIAAAGPIITLLQAITAFYFLRSGSWNKYWYAALFTACYMRLVAGAMNIINLNDEGWISNQLGIGTYTLPILVAGLLCWMVYQTAKHYQLSWRFQVSLTVLVVIVSSILILSDQFFMIRLLGW